MGKNIVGDQFLYKDMFSILFGVLRITACCLIYKFHFDGIYNYDSGINVLIPFVIFMFLSGFYARENAKNMGGWVRRRLVRIYVPYLLCAVVVIISNFYMNYKDVNILDVVSVLFGINLFTGGVLYVVSWYVGFIISYYLMYYYFVVLKTKVLKLLPVVFLIVVHNVFGVSLYLLYGFVIGVCFSRLFCRFNVFNGILCTSGGNVARRIKSLVMVVQNCTYEFFLVHGPVLLLLAHVVKMDGNSALLLGGGISIVFAVILKHVAGEIIKKCQWIEVGQRAIVARTL